MSLNKLRANLQLAAKNKAAELKAAAALQAEIEQQLQWDRAQAAIAEANDARFQKAPTLPPVSKVAEALAVAVTKEVKPINGGLVGKNDVTLDMLNAEQLQAIQHGQNGESFCLIGAAGTGKTTTQRLLITELANSGRISRITSCPESKIYGTGCPAVGVFSFTNKAVNNIRDALPQMFKPYCTTLHKVLEFHPVFETVLAKDSKGRDIEKNIRKFIPKFGKTPKGDGLGGKLPQLNLVIVEEAGSIPVDLWETFLSAIPDISKVTFIFLGDLNQLPPVFGDAILGFSLLDLPVVELVTPYRAALLSPITNLATQVKNGKPLSDDELKAFEELNGKGYGEIRINPFTSKARSIETNVMCNSFGQYCYNWVMEGKFKQDESVILIPMNVNFGTIELNKWIGEAFRVKDKLTCYHVIAGFESHYFCVGDRVLFNKSECEILGFEVNRGYTGVMPVAPSANLDRWGRNKGNELLQTTKQSIEDLLAIASEQVGEGNTARQASHIITLRDLNTGEEVEAKTAGDVNNMLFTWALSIHKSQGSEWPHVIVVLHDSHKKMWKRELIYTAITRARSLLEIYYSGERGKTRCSAFQVGVLRSEYQSTTLQGKLDYFRKQRKKAEFIKNLPVRTPEQLAALQKPLIGDN
ncbi:putative DNA helicase [Aeromonas phage P5]|nr:putative DNA helicase [Aeromonas phage P5]